MTVKQLKTRGYDCNTYAVTADGENCILIDCANPSALKECVSLGLTPRAVFLTHGHFDHVGGCGELYANGAHIYCGEREKDFIFSEENRGIFGGVYIPDFKVYKTLADGEEVTLCGITVRAISTPGHTAGGVAYLIGGALFTGDTLFCGGVGRCDLPGGSWDELVNSVKKLFALEGDFTVYCGHGESTTLLKERKYNPYVRV